MDIKLDFNPEEMAQKMADSIVNSTFKASFQKAVDEQIKKLNATSWSSNSIIERVVETFITDSMHELLRTEYKETIYAAIKAKFIEEKFDKICAELVEKIEVKSRY